MELIIEGNGIKTQPGSPLHLFTTEKKVFDVYIREVDDNKFIVFWQTEVIDDLGRGGVFVQHGCLGVVYESSTITYYWEAQRGINRTKS